MPVSRWTGFWRSSAGHTRSFRRLASPGCCMHWGSAISGRCDRSSTRLGRHNRPEVEQRSTRSSTASSVMGSQVFGMTSSSVTGRRAGCDQMNDALLCRYRSLYERWNTSHRAASPPSRRRAPTHRRGIGPSRSPRSCRRSTLGLCWTRFGVVIRAHSAARARLPPSHLCES